MQSASNSGLGAVFISLSKHDDPVLPDRGRLQREYTFQAFVTCQGLVIVYL
jgi:hypothetical protein